MRRYLFIRQPSVWQRMGRAIVLIGAAMLLYAGGTGILRLAEGSALVEIRSDLPMSRPDP